jgi:hypothetical protein
MAKRKRISSTRDSDTDDNDASGSELELSVSSVQKRVRWEGNSGEERLDTDNTDDEAESQVSEKVRSKASANYRISHIESDLSSGILSSV